MPTLRCLPCLDSDAMATSRHRELAVSRHVAASLGHSALQAIQQGCYTTAAGEQVDWAEAVASARAARVSIKPDAELPDTPGPDCRETRVLVTNETTLGAAWRLAEQGLAPLALNFANGIHPGGGFLNGATAQEEVLCRSSALFHTLDGDPMYRAHAQRGRPDSTDWAILSPHVPVFRTDYGTALAHYWLLNVLTCAAPYAPAIGQPEAGDLLRRRIHRILAIARRHGYTTLVLGAWGCGAFGNDPAQVARDFRVALAGEFRGAFADVVFAIADWSPERRFLGPFRDTFGTWPAA